MEKRIIISGFGGQGVLSAGIILSYSAIAAGKYPTFFPSYGAEQRGGTSNCTVIIDDHEVASPVTSSPNILICMNQPSVNKFQSWLVPNGILVYNLSLVNVFPSREDIFSFGIDANRIAMELGDVRFANMVMLGYTLSITKIVDINHLFKGIEVFFKEKNKLKLIEPNQNAALVGFEHYTSAKID